VKSTYNLDPLIMSTFLILQGSRASRLLNWVYYKKVAGVESHTGGAKQGKFISSLHMPGKTKVEYSFLALV
jgi:hypothetical protein